MRDFDIGDECYYFSTKGREIGWRLGIVAGEVVYNSVQKPATRLCLLTVVDPETEVWEETSPSRLRTVSYHQELASSMMMKSQ